MSTSSQSPSKALLTPIHQQNLDLFAFALKCVSSGDPIQLDRAGLAQGDVDLLRNLSLSQLTELSDRGLQLSTYLADARERHVHEGLSLALIEQRAPRELIMQLFKMSTRKYAATRQQLGITGGRGRPFTAVIDCAVEHRIWRLWVVLANPTDPQQLRRPEHWLLLAFEFPDQLRTAWALIQRWARRRESLTAFSGDRSRLGEQRCRTIEMELRNKHQAAMVSSLNRNDDEKARNSNGL
jgi:hypothetical protein